MTPGGGAASGRIDAQTQDAVRAFLRHLAGRYAVRQAILFGSRARQTNTPESDADLAIVLDGARGDRMAVTRDMAGISVDALLETGILVNALPLWADDLQDPATFHNPDLLATIEREGLRL